MEKEEQKRFDQSLQHRRDKISDRAHAIASDKSKIPKLI